MGAEAWLRRRDQIMLAAGVVLGLAALGYDWWNQGGAEGQLLEIDQAAVEPPEFSIDLNRAEWPELALLPGIGERLAGRIIAVRQQKGGFHSAEQLLEVKGIGPKKLAAIRPYLTISAPPTSDAPSSRNESWSFNSNPLMNPRATSRKRSKR